MKYLILLILVLSFGCSSSKFQSSDATATTKPVAINSISGPVVDNKNVVLKKNEQSKLTCNKGQETRIIELILNGNSCTLNYTKFGKMKSVASSTLGPKHCEKTKIKILTKLEKSGFQCI